MKPAVADIAARLEERLAHLEQWYGLKDGRHMPASPDNPAAQLARIAAERKIIGRYREAEGFISGDGLRFDVAYSEALGMVIGLLAEGHGIS